MVVAPLSTIQNWQNEANKCVPGLRTFIFHGEKSVLPKLLQQLKFQRTWDLCITTFDMIVKNIKSIKHLTWNYFVVDEGHLIKNFKSASNQAVNAVKSHHRLMLTGTPLHVSQINCPIHSLFFISFWIQIQARQIRIFYYFLFIIRTTWKSSGLCWILFNRISSSAWKILRNLLIPIHFWRVTQAILHNFKQYWNHAFYDD